MYSSALSALSAEQRQVLLTDAPLLTLPAVFATIADPRSKHGQRYDLPFLLVCLTAALLCNCNSTEAIGQWCREQQALEHAFVWTATAYLSYAVALSLASAPPLQPTDRMGIG